MFVITAIIIDLLVGDPRGIPHPVIGMGKLIARVESVLRKWGAGRAAERALGVLLVLIVLTAVYAAACLTLWLAALIHPIVRSIAAVWLISTTIAIKGLGDAAMHVFRPLVKGDLDSARTKVGYIVGRETHALSEREVTRATVETVAENIVDAVVSPLFYALIGGAPLALLYRAVNTLDSMVGYKNDKYRYFGWASARLDDVLNYIPARITGLLILAAALLTKGLNAGRAWQTMRRDASGHPSPNSGIPEAAVAGALGIQLGGFNSYGGIMSERARMGTPVRELAVEDIRQTIRILRLTAAIIVLLLLLAAGSLYYGEIR
ncbi:adenosylcobinamide-phosphate synthase CbiB [Paenibacillus forsythiae]